MKETVWKKYEEIEGLPKDLYIEICNGLGEEVEFDKNYSEFYFIGGEAVNLVSPKGLNRSCEWVEKKIYEVCERKDLTVNDILRILAWKMGKIDHDVSNDDKRRDKQDIKYYKNWAEEDNEKNIIVSVQFPYQQIVKGNAFKTVAERIGELRKHYSEDHNASVIWEELLKLSDDGNKASLRGLGTVYLITLLHFITGGEYPIYDRFAMASLAVWQLKSLKNEVTITKNSVVRGSSLPSKDTKQAKELLSAGIYCNYIKVLKQFCEAYYGNEDEWKTNRDVDRALWVFGHFFEVKD